MLYALICKDKAGGLPLRMETRPDHVAYLDGLNARGVLKMAGPLLDDSEQPCGSLVIVDAANKDAAQDIADSDPYAKAGLFADVEIRPFRWAFNNPES